MREMLAVPVNVDPPDPHHTAFQRLVPAIRRAAEFRFRFVRCPDRRADLVAETIGLAWAWFVRLVARGKDPSAFPTAFASLAARSVAAGRRVAGGESRRDALARAGRPGGGPGCLPADRVFGPLADAVLDNTRSAVPDQVQFRLDVPRWLSALKPRDRSVAVRLALGHGTGEVAGQFGLSAARVSQLRGELRRSYLRFLAGPAPR